MKPRIRIEHALAPVLVAVLSACGQDAGLDTAASSASANPSVTTPAEGGSSGSNNMMPTSPATPPGAMVGEAAVLPEAFPSVLSMETDGFQKTLTPTEYVKRLVGDSAAELRSSAQLLLAADFYTASTPALPAGQIELTTISTLPDAVSNGDVLVALRGVKSESF
jgi:hypothetical protein